MTQALGVELPHCEREGVKLADPHEEPLLLLLAEAHSDAVTQALGVALPQLEGEEVMLADEHVEPLVLMLAVAHSEGVKLVETLAEPLKLGEPVKEDRGVREEEDVPQGLVRGDADTLEQCVALPHCDTEGVSVAEAHKEPLALLLMEALSDKVAHALGVAEPHCEREGVKLEETHAEAL